MDAKILFNMIPTQPGRSKRHGGGRYGECVIKHIITKGYPVVCVYDSERWLNPEIKQLLVGNKVTLYDIKNISIEQIIEKEGIKTYYTPMVNPNTINDWNCNIVGTIHGLRSLEMPADSWYIKYKGFKNAAMYFVYKFFGSLYKKRKKQFLSSVLSKSNFYPITVSRHSSYSIQTYFHYDNRNKEIPIFYSPSTNTGVDITKKKYFEKYIFIVSAFVPFKNGLRAIVALDRLFSNGFLDGFKVKITGLSSPSKYRYSIKNKDRFEFLGFVSDVELEQLYHDAYCLVYPSLNEGFGYPPIEAMHYGIPVLASPFTSITEVCGDAVIYFNPFSIEELMGRLLYIASSESRNLYSQKSLRQYEIIHEKQTNDLSALVDYIYQL